ncbi:hypothetical protein F5976_08200 [Lacticaseibacillus rhamnosus]|nr:hypothetical protein F5976_08200 [Lacticaseibacillus rhamnosus]
MALVVMARFWPLRPRSLCAGFCAGERVMGVNQNISGLKRAARFWPLRPRSLHADFCAGKRAPPAAPKTQITEPSYSLR